MSVFLAVDLDSTTRALGAALIETHRAHFEAKWLRTDKLHCTLVFLGNPGADQIAQWTPRLDALATRHRELTLRLQGAGTFVTARAASVLWLGVGGELDQLAGLQRDALETLGGEERGREFLPHVTLARGRVPGMFEPLSQQLSDFASAEFGVGHLSLYESSSEIYRVVHQAPLTG